MDKLDTKILMFLDKHGASMPSNVSRNIKVDCTFRLEQLRDAKMVAKEIVNRKPVVCLDIIYGYIDETSERYIITDNGKIALQNYRTEKAEKDFRFWFPMIVSFLISLTALIISIVK